MTAKWPWDDVPLFFLTRTPVVEITVVGDPCDKTADLTGTLWRFANQTVGGNSDPDLWGRNYIDQMFPALCYKVYLFVDSADGIVFKSLSTRKEGDKYLVRVRYNDVDLEMEVIEMLNYFRERLADVFGP